MISRRVTRIDSGGRYIWGMKISKLVAFLGLFVFLLSTAAVAQDRWVGKTLRLPDIQGFCYDLSDAALYSAVTGTDAGHLLDFICSEGTKVVILESSYHGLSPGDKFYRAKILSGGHAGEIGWFDGWRMKNSPAGKAPKRPTVDSPAGYPKANGW